jgi:hypothetical protein
VRYEPLTTKSRYRFIIQLTSNNVSTHCACYDLSTSKS